MIQSVAHMSMASFGTVRGLSTNLVDKYEGAYADQSSDSGDTGSGLIEYIHGGNKDDMTSPCQNAST